MVTSSFAAPKPACAAKAAIRAVRTSVPIICATADSVSAVAPTSFNLMVPRNLICASCASTSALIPATLASAARKAASAALIAALAATTCGNLGSSRGGSRSVRSAKAPNATSVEPTRSSDAPVSCGMSVISRSCGPAAA